MTRVSTQTKRASYVEEDRPLALRVGARLRKARTNAGMTQAQLSAGRYTKAYVSALENGLSKPSMAALNFFADRLQLPIERFLSDEQPAWTRLEADLRLASGDLQGALDAYDGLLETAVTSRDDEPERALAYLEQAGAMLEQLDERKRALFLFALATSYNSLGDYE